MFFEFRTVCPTVKMYMSKWIQRLSLGSMNYFNVTHFFHICVNVDFVVEKNDLTSMIFNVKWTPNQSWHRTHTHTHRELHCNEQSSRSNRLSKNDALFTLYVYVYCKNILSPVAAVIKYVGDPTFVSSTSGRIFVYPIFLPLSLFLSLTLSPSPKNLNVNNRVLIGGFVG